MAGPMAPSPNPELGKDVDTVISSTATSTAESRAPASTSASASPRPSPRRGVSLPQQPPTRSRIEEILETGRQRSESLGIAGYDLQTLNRQRGELVLGNHATQDEVAKPRSPMDTESSADEQTAILRRGSTKGTGAENGGASDYRTTKPSSLRGRNGPSSNLHNEAPSNPEQQSEEQREPWWKKQLAKYGSLELENKGSVARDHLALERTFLAWLRTSLAFASIGIAVTQLFRLNTTISGDTSNPDGFVHIRALGKPLGATFLSISIVVLILGFHRYFESQHWIIRGKFPASRGSIAILSLIAILLMLTSLILVLVVEPRAFEK